MSGALCQVWVRLQARHPVSRLWRKYCQAVEEKNPAPYFFSSHVQELMFQLNDRQQEEVFKPRKLGQKLESPQYVFMTEEELAKERKRISTELRRKLQVPPILAPRKPVQRFLQQDTDIAGLYDSKLVCVDISPDIPKRERLVSVREPDGTLRTANWDERDRVIQVFVPVQGRSVTPPPIFENENLQAVLDREDYILVLDLAALQFEPDDPTYIRVTSTTFDHVDATRQYDKLQNTRHFGALAFHLAWLRKCDNLMLHFIQLGRLDKAVDLISLFRALRSDAPTSDQDSLTQQALRQSGSGTSSDSGSSSESEQEVESAHVETVREYITNDSVKRPVLELALQKYEQLSIERRRVAEEQRRADGQL